MPNIHQNLTQKIRNDFDRLARYDKGGWNHNNHYHHFLIQQLPKPCHSVLDLGCGTGEFSRLLATRAEKVVAIDFSPKTIEIARERYEHRTNVYFLVADILQWDFPTEEFDAIVSIATVHHLPIEILLPKLKNALKPGGVLMILDLLAHETLRDFASDFIAVPLNWLFQKTKNRRLKKLPEAVAAMREHIRTDSYLTLSEVRRIYPRFLGRVTIRKHLFWRYSVVWEKSVF
ncbi:class I SAM-dependent methyltransferase [Myxosarcina sp. GI1(2024)]